MAASKSNLIVFEDIFVIDKLVEEESLGKVTRIEANESEKCGMFMQLDVNTGVYPMEVGDRFSMALAWTLNLDGTPDPRYFSQEQKESLADNYEYVMHGKLFKISDEETGTSSKETATRITKSEITASFGGLLMILKGSPSYLSQLEFDQQQFLLINKL